MKKEVIAVLQARMSSSRLPGKVMLLINNNPMIFWQIRRIKKSLRVNRVVVAISSDTTDNVLAEYLDSIHQEYIRGPLDNVLARFTIVETIYKPDVIIRLTGDCPFVMPDLIDEMLGLFDRVQVDYLSNILELTFPNGLDIEIIKCGVLTRLNSMNLSDSEREHVTLGLLNRRSDYSVHNFTNAVDLSHYRWTVDTEKDFYFVSNIFKYFYNEETEFRLKDLTKYLEKFPQLNQIEYRKN
jgi:spore coat polysaccharide biosynthesis protein SpsF